MIISEGTANVTMDCESLLTALLFGDRQETGMGVKRRFVSK